MWKEVELKPREGLFLMKNGLFQESYYIDRDKEDDIVGYYIGHNRVISVDSSEYKMSWSLYYNNIPGLTNYIYPPGSLKPYDDMDGRYNTNCIIDYCRVNNMDLSRYPAFNYCINYSPGYRDGEWYLPSAGELELFIQSKNKFMHMCSISGKETNIGNLCHYYFWSSTSHSDNTSWGLNFRATNPTECIDKNSFKAWVIPFLKLDNKNVERS